MPPPGFEPRTVPICAIPQGTIFSVESYPLDYRGNVNYLKDIILKKKILNKILKVLYDRIEMFELWSESFR